MSWDAIGAIGELTGAVLLLGSLAYVGIQIRDTKKQMTAAGAQARSDALRDLWKLRMSPEFLDAQLKKEADPSSLSDKEKLLLGNWFFLFLNFMQNNYYQRESGMLESSQSGALDSMPFITEDPLHLEIWGRAKQGGTFSKEFIEHVDKLISASDA